MVATGFPLRPSSTMVALVLASHFRRFMADPPAWISHSLLSSGALCLTGEQYTRARNGRSKRTRPTRIVVEESRPIQKRPVALAEVSRFAGMTMRRRRSQRAVGLAPALSLIPPSVAPAAEDPSGLVAHLSQVWQRGRSKAWRIALTRPCGSLRATIGFTSCRSLDSRATAQDGESDSRSERA